MQKKYLAAIYQKVRRIYEDEASGKFLCLPDATQVLSPEVLKCLAFMDSFSSVNDSSDEAVMAFERNENTLFDFSHRMNSPIRGITTRVEEGELLWDIYDSILNNAILAKGKVDSAMEKEYRRASGILFKDGELRNPSDEYETYRTYRDQYFKAIEECDSINNSISFSSGNEAKELQQELELAKTRLSDIQQDWNLHGFKEIVEEALTIFENSLVDNPYSFWQELKKNFNPDLDLHARADRGYYATTYIFPTTFAEEQWDSIRISGDELEKLYDDAPEVIQSLCNDGEDFTGISSIQLEYRSVRVERPWFNPSIFKSRLWRLPDELNGKISYGSDSLIGRFPAYISALLLLRNIQITFKGGKTVDSGPVFSDQASSNQGVSIMAYICKRIPTSPNPDENADWADGFAARKKAELKVEQKAGGKVSVKWAGQKADSGVFEVGERFIFEAVPDEKYILSQWKINGEFINNTNYTYACELPEGGLTVIPCWELGDSLDSIQVNIHKDTLVSFDKGPDNLDMNRYGKLCRIKVIGEKAFQNYTNLCSVNLGNFVEIIGEKAFSNCQKLERISIPASTLTIHKDAFARDNYQSDPIIQVSPDNETYTTLNGILIEKRKTCLVHTLTCKCGAKYFFKDLAPEVCPACGCPMDSSLTQQEVVRLPDVKAPFKVTQQEAGELVRKFYAKKGFAAKDFKEAISQSDLRLRPVYAPYWEWNVQANGSFTVKVYKSDNSKQANTNVENEIETHTRNVSIPETKVSVPASLVVKGDALDTNSTYTEPFSFENAPAETAYEVYSKNYAESLSDERERVLKILRDLAKKPYNSSLLKTCEDGVVNYVSEENRLLTNPIWLGSFDYKEKPYSFYVDGYSKKVTAKNAFPKNWGKIAILVGSILAAIALIALLIVLLKPKSSKNKDSQAPTVSSNILALTDNASDHFTIQWEQATDNITSGKDISYEIYLFTPDDPVWRVAYVGKGIDSYTFSDLKPETNYSCYVSAKDEKGNACKYEALNLRTPATTTSNPSSGTIILSKPESVYSDGVYMSSSRLHEDLGKQFNRNCFELSFDFKNDPGPNNSNNILTFDTSYRALGLIMRKDNTICVTINNAEKTFDTPVSFKPGEWTHIKLIYDNGRLTINDHVLQVGTLNGPGNNILSTNNFSNGSSFKGTIRNLIVRNGEKTVEKTVEKPLSQNSRPVKQGAKTPDGKRIRGGARRR